MDFLFTNEFAFNAYIYVIHVHAHRLTFTYVNFHVHIDVHGLVYVMLHGQLKYQEPLDLNHCCIEIIDTTKLLWLYNRVIFK